MASFRFLHAADIHLDGPLAGLARRDRVPPHVTRDCTRRAFANVIDLAIRQDVAFVVIAGDLYDDDWKDFSTGLHFAHEMRRLARPCLIVRGNHDAASHITRQLTLPENVHEFSSHRAETFRGLDALGVAVHGRSFPHRAVPEDLSHDYPHPLPGRLNIGVLHTSADDPGEHATYAPCTVASLIAREYDYWALGHIHERRVLHEQRPFVVFPGNTQGRSIRETGAKGCTLVEVEDDRIVRLTAHATDVLRWAQVTVDAAGAQSRAELAARMRFALAEAEAGAEGRPLIARVALQGTTPLHGALLGDAEALDAECRAAAAAVSGDLHIERVRLATTSPASAADTGDSVALLAAAFAAALDDPDTVERLLADFRKLVSEMPHLTNYKPADLPQTAAALRDLAPDAWQMVAQMLAGDA